MSTIPDAVFARAIEHFWRVRDAQALAQIERGVADQGSRSAVTGGRQMHGFAETIVELMVAAGVAPEAVHLRETALPGFYRPTKAWDIVVASEGRLLAAIELKSQVGPSFGNNFNNRTEEALGSAVDLWIAYREGVFAASPQPWLGYLFVLEHSPASQAPVRVNEPHFPVASDFRGASYARRYELLLRRLVRERQYNAACLLLTARSQGSVGPNYFEPANDLNAVQFLDQLLRHVAPSAL